jgi:hypothetical protein
MPRKKSFEPKIGEMKKELRLLRLKECPPISKMKKAEVSVELMRLKGVKDEATRTTAVEGLRKVEEETKARNEVRKEEGEKVVKGRKNMIAKAMEGLSKTTEEIKKKSKPLKKLPAIDEANEAMSESDTEGKGSKRRKNYVPKRIEPPPKPVAEKPKRGRPAKKIAEKMAVYEPAETPAEKKKRFAKGSEEAKAYMASLRAKKSK